MADLSKEWEDAKPVSSLEKDWEEAAPRKLNDAHDAPSQANPLDRGGAQTFANRAFSGATLGLGDKILAAIAAGTNGEGDKAPFLQRYKEALSRGDQVNAVNKKAHPVEDFTGPIAGALATSRLLPGGAANSLKGAVVNGAVTGVGTGLVGGYGASRADPGSLDELKDILKGGGVGGVVGGVVGGLGYGVSRGVQAVRDMIKAKADSKGAELIERALAADKAAADAPDAAVQKVATTGPDTAGSVVESEADDALASQLPSTKARQARLGGEVNAARNNAQARLLENPEDAEAGRLMENIAGRKFNPSRRSTPEYQNSGPLTEIAPSADIKGMQVEAQPRYTPQQEAKAATIADDIKTAWGTPGELSAEPETLAHFDNSQPLPKINPLARGERVGSDLGDSELTGNIRRPTTSTYADTNFSPTKRTPVEIDSPPVFQGRPNVRPDLLEAGRAIGPVEGMGGPPPAGLPGVTGSTAREAPRALEGAPFGGPELGAEPGRATGDQNPLLQYALRHQANNANPAGPMSMAGGFARGAGKAALRDSLPAYAMSHVLPHDLAYGIEAAHAVGSGVNGAYQTMNPAQQYNLWNSAGSFGTNPLVRKYLEATLNAGRLSTESQASQAAVSNYDHDNKDPRSP